MQPPQEFSPLFAKVFVQVVISPVFPLLTWQGMVVYEPFWLLEGTQLSVVKGALQFVQLDEKGLAMFCRIAKLVASKSTTSPLHQVLTVAMKTVRFPVISAWV